MDFSKIAGAKPTKGFDKILKAMGKTSMASKKTYNKDEDYWYPQRDSDGNAKAVIRFLPGLESEDNPHFIELFAHSFKGDNGKWYFANCPTTISSEDNPLKCPVCAINSQFVTDCGGDWEAMSNADQDIVRNRKRKQSFHTNILVIDDKKNPENNGKVFKYKFGLKIMEKLGAKLRPEFDDIEPVNVFDYKKGANFRLSICKVDGWVNYDKSEFAACSALDADTLKLVKEKQFEILPIVAPKAFKDYDVLVKMLEKVVSGEVAVLPEEPEVDKVNFADMAKGMSKKETPEVDEGAGDDVPLDIPVETSTDDDDDYFKKLSEGLV